MDIKQPIIHDRHIVKQQFEVLKSEVAPNTYKCPDNLTIVTCRNKGPLDDTVVQLTGGVKSCLGYCGSKNIHSLHKNAEFIQITSSGIVESHPHDINITQDSPNYRKPDFK